MIKGFNYFYCLIVRYNLLPLPQGVAGRDCRPTAAGDKDRLLPCRPEWAGEESRPPTVAPEPDQGQLSPS